MRNRAGDTKKGTLLENALAARASWRRRGYPGQETEELLLAYLDGRVANSQVAAAMGVRPSNVTTLLGTLFRSLYREGRISVAKRAK